MLRAPPASALPAPDRALVGLGLGVLIRHSATTRVTSVFTLLMLPPDPGSLGYTATVAGSWIV
ncbi:hypothetical protein ACFWA5_35315 [Streptomyces mirabilis]|uniref:hypothetical protein n=1 Tax=Streptomyces mirabilis TaxID=68239 RepID=UPI00365F09A5